MFIYIHIISFYKKNNFKLKHLMMLKHIQWFYPQNCPSCVVLQFKSLNTFCRFLKKNSVISVQLYFQKMYVVLNLCLLLNNLYRYYSTQYYIIKKTNKTSVAKNLPSDTLCIFVDPLLMHFLLLYWSCLIEETYRENREALIVVVSDGCWRTYCMINCTVVLKSY